MSTVAKVLVAIVALLLGALGLPWMFAPERMAAEFGIVLGSVDALNIARGDIGGMFLAGAGLCGLGIATGEGRWLQAVAAVIAMVALGRSVGLVADGFSPNSLVAIGVELAMTGVLLWAAGQARRRKAFPA